MNRIRAGWCQVPNPLNYNQLSYVSLKPDDVDTVVFWSKNPKPMLKYLSELDDRGFKYYFQFTINDYPKLLEPNIPNLDERIRTFQKISNHLTPPKVIWRYDPIIISNLTSPDFHRERFSKIARTLRGYTKRVMVSIVDFYQKTENRLTKLENEGFRFSRDAVNSQSVWYLLRDLSSIAKNNEIEIFSCAEEKDFSNAGVPPGNCIDGELLYQLWSLHGHTKKDTTQRPACLCVVSKDIGVNDTCIHGCPYCYSTRNMKNARRRHSEHIPESSIIWGRTRPLSEAEKADQQKTRLL